MSNLTTTNRLIIVGVLAIIASILLMFVGLIAQAFWLAVVTVAVALAAGFRLC